MNKEQILSMDPYILLSWINMKLRDEFSNLNILCEEYGVAREEILNKLNAIDYGYNIKNNQFVSIEVL